MLDMMLFEFLKVYGDVVDQGKTPLERLREEHKDFSAEAAFLFIVLGNIVLFGAPLAALWFLARVLNFV